MQTHPNTYNTHYNNFSTAYLSNGELIPKTNFQNNGHALHNNMSANLFSESINEYTIDIDSKDRDISVYNNPFKYTVIFAPVPAGVSRRDEWIDPTNKSLGTQTIRTTYLGSIAPHICKSFKNVKYIRIDSIILPKYSGIIFDIGLGQWILDTTKSLINDRFVVMKITNLGDEKTLSTNRIVDSSGIKLLPEKIPVNGNFYKAIPANDNKIIRCYKDSHLGNVDKMYFEFYDSSGNALMYNDLDPSQPIDDVRNPANINLQHNITITFGVAENEIATDTKYFK